LGARGSRCCILNGAAARTCQVGDEIIICSAVYASELEIPQLRPRILAFNKHNLVTSRLTYSVERLPGDEYRFSILDETGEALPVPLRAY
jgi:aspartate 1-decarboxylase